MTDERQILDLILNAGQLGARGDYARARELLEPALRSSPPHPVLWHNWAQILADLGQVPEAEQWFGAVVERWPNFLPPYASLIWLKRYRSGPRPGPEARAELARILNNQGNAILATGDALQASLSYREAVALDAASANAWSNLSNSLRIMGMVSEAETTARCALAIDSRHAGAWNNLGCALTDLGRSPEADRCFDETLRIEPGHPSASHNAGGGRLFNLLFREDHDAHVLFRAHRAWGQSQADRLAPRPEPRQSLDSKLRIGFLSGDFRTHAMAMFVVPLLEHLDRTQFEVVCYANQRSFDAVSAAVRALPLTWRETADLTDQACADLIRADRLDLLIDLSGHTDGHRMGVLTLRPAPRIATWLGYMSTTGHPAIDYRITDRWTDPEPVSAETHTEQLAYLDGCQLTFRPVPSAPGVQPTPALTQGVITFGSLNNVRKLSMAALRTWARILQAVPDSRLMLQAKLLGDPGTTGYFRGVFEALGIAGDRLEMRPYAHQHTHLNTYHAIDIALDPFPYSGGATTCDALWMGVPVVTLAGDRSVGRMGVSLLKSLGRPNWIAQNQDDYVRIAVDLASDPARLNQTRLELRRLLEQSPARDESGFARNFGRLIQRLVGSTVTS